MMILQAGTLVFRTAIFVGLASVVTTIIYFTPSPTQDFLSCERPCDPLELAMICRIKIYLESYSTMSRTACGNCPKNSSDCFQPGCIFLEGFTGQRLLTANRNIPGPTIKVCQNDILVVDVVNGVPGLEANVHWHGQTVHETPFMDGTPMISQCPIPSRSTFQYKLRAAAAGTHFWQVVTAAESGETGPLAGALVVRQPAINDPQRDLYDTDELLLVLTQLHGPASSLLMNGMNGKDVFAPRLPEVNPGMRHRLRIVNVGGGRGCPITLSIDSHAMQLLALDGAPTVARTLLQTITLANGERADVVVRADQKPKSSYWVHARLGGHCDHENVDTKAILPYIGSAELPQNMEENSIEETFKLSREQSELAPLQLLLETKSITEAPPKPDRTLVFGFGYGFASLLRIPTYTIGLTGLIGHVNNLSLTLGGSPLVTQPNEAWSSQAYCNSEMNIPPRCNEGNICPCMHIVQLEKEETVEIVLADLGENEEIAESHVWHMHGHSFHVMAHSTSEQTREIPRTHEALKDIAKKIVRRPDTPPLKDNVVVPQGGVVVLQFQAKNPGYWLFREERAERWMSGLGVIFQVGRDRDIPTIPSDFPTCKSWVGPDFFLI